MILAGKALAVLDAAPAVTVKHIHEVAPYVLRHRIVANYQAAGEGITAADIVQHLLTEIGQPQYA